MSRGTESLNLVIASMAIELIEKDPELIKRLQEHCAECGAPFDASNLNALVLSMASMDVLEVGRRVVHEIPDDEPEEHEHGPRVGALIPIPATDGAARDSADALNIGSFAVEYLHAGDGVLEAFRDWMDEAHPGKAGEGALNIRREQVVAADKTLTVMAHVADHIATGRGEVRVGHDEKGYATSMSERDTWSSPDDGTRHV